jgi:uncharacterized BrkB/YihY/UPF0761 family membrane protein
MPRSSCRPNCFSLVTPTHVKLGIGAVVSALLAFWSARQGIVALMAATNIAYYERERRGILKQIAISLGFTLLTGTLRNGRG